MALRKPGHYAMLLRVRKRQEEVRAQTLASTRREIRQTENERASIGDEQQRTLEKAGQLAKEVFDPSEVRRYHQYERHLARLAVQKDAEIRSLRRRADKERRDLEEAMKRRRISEKLEEHTAEAYHEHVRKEDQKRADETASNYAALELRTSRERRKA